MTRFVTPIVALTLLTSSLALAAPRWSAADEGTFRLTAFSLTRTVDNRLPGPAVGQLARDGQRVYAHVEVFNKGDRQKLTMVWKRNGKERHRYTLDVGRSPAWRTWSYLTTGAWTQGAWSVAILDESGTLLGEQFLLITRPAVTAGEPLTQNNAPKAKTARTAKDEPTKAAKADTGKTAPTKVAAK